MMMMAATRSITVSSGGPQQQRRIVAGQRAWSSFMASRDERSLGAEVCRRGDMKTKKGNQFKGLYGNERSGKDKMIEQLKDKVEVPRSTPWPLPFKLI